MVAALSIVALLMAAFWNGGISATQLVIILAGMSLQLLLAQFEGLSSRVARLCPVSPGERRVPRHFGWLGTALSATPILTVLSLPASALFLGCALASAALPLLRLMRESLRSKTIARETANTLQQGGFDIVFYTSGRAEAAYQINQWLPVAEHLGLRACICIRNRSIASAMQPTTLPVFYARSPADVEKVLTSGVSLVLYPANAQENAIPLRHYELQHFFINHGESDKVVNQSKFLMAYDRILVAGPMAEERLVRAGLPVRPGQVVQVGRPQVELMVERQQPGQPVQRLLYAPTWEGFVEKMDYSSVSPFGLSALYAILARTAVEIVIKPHPFTGQRSRAHKRALAEMAALAASNPRLRMVDPMASIYDEMNRCDLLLADVGSVVNDFLASGKPMILLSTRGEPEADFIARNPTAAAAYVLSDPAQAGEQVAAIAAQDIKAAERAAIRKHSLGDFPEGALARFKAELDDGIARGRNASAVAPG